jgi:hypothetical protein
MGRVEHDHAASFALQVQRAGQSGSAGADYRDVKMSIVHLLSISA